MTSPATTTSAKPDNPYTVKITCKKRGCKEVRFIKPQDAFQVKYCKPHQAEVAAERRRARAAEKRAAAKKVAR